MADIESKKLLAGAARMVLMLVVLASPLTAEPTKPPLNGASLPAKAARPETGTIKIVLVGTAPDHPYASHMYLHECRLLATCLKQTPNVEAVVARDWPDDATIRGARAIVFYSKPAGDIVLDRKHRQQFEKLMADGVGFAAIHWGPAAAAPSAGRWRRQERRLGEFPRARSRVSR